MKFIKKYFSDTKSILDEINFQKIEKAINLIVKIKRNKGRIFFWGRGKCS